MEPHQVSDQHNQKNNIIIVNNSQNQSSDPKQRNHDQNLQDFNQSDDLFRIQNLQINPEMMNFIDNIYPEFDSNVNYYREFWKTYVQNEVLIAQLQEQIREKYLIQQKIQETESYITQLEQYHENQDESRQKKKNRRTASEIQKEHICPYPDCSKPYGSEVSLNLHIKLKHGGGNKTEREKLARQVLQSKIKGEKLSDLPLNLPPGYLEALQTFQYQIILVTRELAHQ